MSSRSPRRGHSAREDRPHHSEYSRRSRSRSVAEPARGRERPDKSPRQNSRRSRSRSAEVRRGGTRSSRSPREYSRRSRSRSAEHEQRRGSRSDRSHRDDFRRSPARSNQLERRSGGRERSEDRGASNNDYRFMNNDRMRMLDSADRGRDSRQQRGPLPDPSGRDRGQDRQPQYEARNGSRFNGDSFPGREQGGSTYETYLERRQAERSASTVSIWPASPEYSPTVHDDGPSVAKGKKGSRRDSSRARERRKRSASRSESSSDSSEVQRKKRRDSRKSKKESKSSSRRKDRSKDRSGRSKQRESKKKDRRRARSESSSSASDDSSSSAISVKAPQAEPVIDTKRASVQPAIEDDTVQDYWREKAVEQVDDAIVGPMPMNVGESKNDERAYGGALLAGEGSAMAAYLQSGKRIPRRGEIGLTSNEIEKHEDVGFVMSGSRHRRMNAVRIRKENQVISAEEKRALLLFNQEANLKKEADIIANFKDMVAGKIRGKDPNAEEEEEK